MTYFDAWSAGYKEGKDFSIEQINKHLSTDFKTLEQIIVFFIQQQETA
jgi:hypothetical protein